MKSAYRGGGLQKQDQQIAMAFINPRAAGFSSSSFDGRRARFAARAIDLLRAAYISRRPIRIAQTHHRRRSLQIDTLLL